MFSFAIKGVELLSKENLEFCKKSFRFIANDRLIAENTIENQNIFKEKINKVLNERYSKDLWEFNDISKINERLAFTVNFTSNINLLN